MRKTVRILAVGALAAAGLTFGAGAASAHVTVSAPGATPGAYTVLTFRVPNESDTAGTVGIAISIPTDTPLASVRYRTVPGWTAELTKATLPKPVAQGDVSITEAVTKVTFTADAGVRINPGEFAEFDLSVGPLPDVAALTFPTTQTYDDGEVVTWGDPATSGGDEPAHLAPTLALTATEAVDSGHTHGAEVTASPAASGAASESPASESPAAAVPSAAAAAPAAATAAAATPAAVDSTGRVLGVAGIVLGAAGLLVAAIAVRRPTRKADQ